MPSLPFRPSAPSLLRAPPSAPRSAKPLVGRRGWRVTSFVRFSGFECGLLHRSDEQACAERQTLARGCESPKARSRLPLHAQREEFKKLKKEKRVVDAELHLARESNREEAMVKTGANAPPPPSTPPPRHAHKRTYSARAVACTRAPRSSQAACSRDALVWLLYVAIAGVQEVIYEIERGYELKLEGPSIPSSDCPPFPGSFPGVSRVFVVPEHGRQLASNFLTQSACAKCTRLLFKTARCVPRLAGENRLAPGEHEATRRVHAAA